MTDVREILQARVDEDGIAFVMTMFVDMHGRPCAKLIPSSAMDVVVGGAGFAGYAVGPMGQSPASPDLIAIPDPETYVRIPWRPDVAVVQCDVEVEGQPWPYSPRVILRRALERLADERDMRFMVGVEPEYHLVRRGPTGTIEVADQRDRQVNPCYDAKSLTRTIDFLARVSTYANQLGYGNYANDHEDGNGQFEQNLTFADALSTADRLVFVRYMIHVLAEEAGLSATFMPKPFRHLTGNGLHVNVSLWSGDGTANLFAGGGLGEDRYELGLSPLGYAFCGGVLTHARAMSAVMCPTVNSYKRIGAAPPNSGATWAPSYVAYGGNNRTQMVRVPDGNRLEIRAVDGSANPYLAFTAILAAGLDGIDNDVDPGPPNHDNLFDLHPDAVAAKGIAELPPTLLHATELFGASDVMRAAFGCHENEHYADYFAKVKADEFRAWHATVSDWEVDRYLTLF
jgi:glutamine synthetase